MNNEYSPALKKYCEIMDEFSRKFFNLGIVDELAVELRDARSEVIRLKEKNSDLFEERRSLRESNDVLTARLKEVLGHLEKAKVCGSCAQIRSDPDTNFPKLFCFCDGCTETLPETVLGNTCPNWEPQINKEPSRE